MSIILCNRNAVVTQTLASVCDTDCMQTSYNYSTGEVPDDPSIGFLPPNNGTSGQGFVTFRIQANDQVPSLSRIDANASIIFDQNEPILTPPIFNTVRFKHNHIAKIIKSVQPP